MLKICVSPTGSECIKCYKSRNISLKTVPAEFIRDFFIQRNVIINCNHKLCSRCLIEMKSKHAINQKISLTGLRLKAYDVEKYNLSIKWLSLMSKHLKKIVKAVDKHLQTVNYQETMLNKLNDHIKPNKKGIHNVKNYEVDNYDYDKERTKIPQIETSKWKNRIVYDLFSENDCYNFTGHTRSNIIWQSEKCKLNPEFVFYARAWIYKYWTREDFSNVFGFNRPTFSKFLHSTLEIMNGKYAKPVLVNDKPLSEQYWTPATLGGNTPDYVFDLRGINKDDPTNPSILTADSTYQYTQENGTDQDIRKKSMNMHKHAPLVKVHIWACTNGQPFFAQYVFGDGYHGDGKIFASALNLAHIKECKQAIKEKRLNDTHCFRTEEICDTLMNLNAIITPKSQVITDNGYRLKNADPRLKYPLQPISKDDNDAQVTPLAAAHKRSIMAIRNVHERINALIKRNKFCRSKIHIHDIWRVTLVWNIVLADSVVYNGD